MYISSSNKYFIRSTYWKAATAQDRSYRVVPWIPIAATDRKVELERRLARIRKTQENLRTQVRLGDDDFEVYGKYVKTGAQAKFQLIPKEKYDPGCDLPPVKCKEKIEESENDRRVREANNKLEKAAERNLEEDGWSPVRNKRKERSPRYEDESKKSRRFSPAKAGKEFHQQIRNRGLKLDSARLDESSDSETDEDQDENITLTENTEAAGNNAVDESLRTSMNATNASASAGTLI